MTDTIKSLRARVAELEAYTRHVNTQPGSAGFEGGEAYELYCAAKEIEALQAELAALKAGQGEPVAWRCVAPPCKCDSSNFKQCAYAHYTSAPSIPDATVNSLADIAISHIPYTEAKTLRKIFYAFEQYGWVIPKHQWDRLDSLEVMLSAAPEYKGEPDWSTQKKWGE